LVSPAAAGAFGRVGQDGGRDVGGHDPAAGACPAGRGQGLAVGASGHVEDLCAASDGVPTQHDREHMRTHQHETRLLVHRSAEVKKNFRRQAAATGDSA